MGRVQEVEPDPGNGPRGRLYVPSAACPQVLHWVHSLHLTCHPEIKRTLHLLNKHFWWSSMTKDTHDFVLACSVWAGGKPSLQSSSGLLQPLLVPTRPRLQIALDFITGLPPSDVLLHHPECLESDTDCSPQDKRQEPTDCRWSLDSSPNLLRWPVCLVVDASHSSLD